LSFFVDANIDVASFLVVKECDYLFFYVEVIGQLSFEFYAVGLGYI
jgi:hypothetical protein